MQLSDKYNTIINLKKVCMAHKDFRGKSLTILFDGGHLEHFEYEPGNYLKLDNNISDINKWVKIKELYQTKQEQ